jgi:arylsulfatase A-like enzyme
MKGVTSSLLIIIFVIFFFQNRTSAFEKRQGKPNIIMITCHDIGQHLGCYGVETVQTPNIDKLAEKGILFRNAFSTSSVCSPGRGSLHTGRYPQSNGLMGLIHAPWWWQLNDDEKHTAQILRENGYETILVGFNHVDTDAKRLGYQNIVETGKGEEVITQAAVNLIENLDDASTPIFIKIGFHLVHRPFTIGYDSLNGIFVPPYLANTKIIREDLAQYQAQIHYFDKQVGEILSSLEKSKVDKNTVVIFTSDHGIPYPGSKWTARRAGIQIPFIFYMPESVFSGGRKFDDIFSNVDFLPTILSYLEFQIPENMQGLNFVPFISGANKKGPRKYAFAQYTTDMKRDNVSRSVINEKFQLIRYFDQGRTIELPINVNPQLFANHVERAKSISPRPFAQLYNIQNDPFELSDLGHKKEFQNIKNELSSKLLEWMKDVDDPILQGPQKTPYYDKAIKDFINE